MSSNARVVGLVTVDPPLKYSEFKESPFNPEGQDRRRKSTCLVFEVIPSEKETDTGRVITLTVSSVIPARNGNGVDSEILTNLRGLIEEYPKHEFVGEFTVYPDAGYEMFPHRIIARGRSAAKQMAKLDWVDTTEGE